MADFHDRIHFDGSLEELYADIASDYGLGAIKDATVIQVGFEDFNVRLRATDQDVVVKVFSKIRDQDEITRNSNIVKIAVDHGVNHPPILLDADGNLLHTHKSSGLKMIVMKFIEGKTFFDMGQVPNDDQLALIAEQAVKINSIDYSPPYLFDSWAIPNIRWMYDRTKHDQSDEGRQLAEKALVKFEAIPLDNLPKCLAHGDLIKTNLIVGNDGTIYVIDFSVTNVYPRIQEVAVMAANLLSEEKDEAIVPLRSRVERVINAYQKAGGTLTDIEINHAFDYALAGAAMEYMGSVSERMKGDTSSEVAYWENLGLGTLKEALR